MLNIILLWVLYSILYIFCLAEIVGSIPVTLYACEREGAGKKKKWNKLLFLIVYEEGIFVFEKCVI